jgi:hypothetical protein
MVRLVLIVAPAASAAGGIGLVLALEWAARAWKVRGPPVQQLLAAGFSDQ